ncbi:hypothetical protein Tco_1494576, partial [Tanacetum coccineum]
MANLKFADTYNMVAFLSKPIKSEGFEQIMDFLNANTIRYPLTINPTIYILCIEQFWSTVQAKTVNREVQLHALVDGKKIIITELIVKRDLQLEDAEGVDCLPKATIFEQLALMSPKTIAWNEFSSTMASAIICLAKNQKFNFSKFIFESMAKNLDNGGTQSRRNGHKKKDTQVPQSSVPSDSVADEAVYKELDDSLVKSATTASSLEEMQDSGNIIKTRSKATPNEVGSQGTTSGGGPRSQETMGDTIAQTRSENVSKLSNDQLLARGINLVSTHFDDDTDMFGVHDLVGDEVVVESEVTVKAGEKRNVVDAASTIPVSTTIIIDVEITLAQALAEMKSAKPKADKVMIQEPEQGTTTTTPTTIIHVPKPPQDKGKGIMVEEPMVEQVKPMKRHEQMRLDEELTFKLQAEEEEEEEERLAREKAQQIEEVNIAWDDVQAK